MGVLSDRVELVAAKGHLGRNGVHGALLDGAQISFEAETEDLTEG